jgi:hypothetical protein
MRIELPQRFPEICFGPETRGAGEDTGGLARGENENMAGGEYVAGFREPTGVLMSPISMKRWRAQPTRAKGKPGPRRIPINHWEESHGAVPLGYVVNTPLRAQGFAGNGEGVRQLQSNRKNIVRYERKDKNSATTGNLAMNSGTEPVPQPSYKRQFIYEVLLHLVKTKSKNKRNAKE